MLLNTVLLAQPVNAPEKVSMLWWLMLSIGGGLLLLAAWIGVFLVPILIWRRSVRRRGYPGLSAYLRELPMTDEEKLDAVDLTLKGGAICVLGLLFPPLVLVGLVPLYFGARKLASVTLGIAPAGDDRQDGRSE
jgi:hypothetical protein